MSGAFDSTFNAPIPGSSLTHKMGDLPHEKPPKYTDPNEALEYFFKQLTRPDMQRQIWDILEKHNGTVWHITRAILFKAAMSGIIQMNLGMVIYPVVSQMVAAIAKAGNVSNMSDKYHPKFKSKYKEQYIKEGLKELLAKYDKYGWLTKNPQQQTSPDEQGDQTGSADQTQPPAPAQGQGQDQGQQPQGGQQGLLNMAGGGNQ